MKRQSVLDKIDEERETVSPNQRGRNVVRVYVPNRVVPFLYGDRFIPRRYSLKNIEQNEKFNKVTNKDVFKTMLAFNCWNQNSFLFTVNKELEVRQRRILELSDPYVKNCCMLLNDVISIHSNRKDRDEFKEFDWTCKPRLKPMTFSESTHDLPGFDINCDANLVDWSINGQIVAVFDNDVIFWKRKENTCTLYKVKEACAVAYCPNGDYLAVGCKIGKNPAIELWDVACPKRFMITNGKVFNIKHQKVRCIEWSKSGGHLVCGTQHGTVYVLSVPEMKVIHKQNRHKLPIIEIKFSPTMRYLASSDADGNIIIYNWNSCDVHLYVRTKRKISVVFDWHPWNDTDLIFAEEVPASIALLHVPSKEIIAYYQRNDNKIVINSVTFSTITGELLVSIAKQDSDGCHDYQILVMSSLDRLVDVIRIPENGARFVMWSPDGSRLATCGDDETLTIWNFCPDYKHKLECKKYNYKWSSKRKYKYENEYGDLFKMWSCVK
ncbi:protein cortex isoform X2 [Teleopsis dalmanni]|uniref:protein cortex isoform X2 n=1 Tax=Teleopsis dalmanni TaxID=139649 RepID=UPI0018CDCDAC|nr:protein cortex isoform X2 [Teleopsis dalmanni]